MCNNSTTTLIVNLKEKSSMTHATQTIVPCDGDSGSDSESVKPPPAWGRLLSINKNFPTIELIENEYTFGRAQTCSITFDSKEIKASRYFSNYSSTHFKIVRDLKKDYVYIQDLSTNGTFLDGNKIGKNKKDVLKNNSEIALASKVHRVYIYIDCGEKEDTDIPTNVREKYIVSREIGRGAYGEVRLCFTRGDCQRFAMKIISKKHFTMIGAQALAFNQQIESECAILRALDHPCIIRLFDFFESASAVYIIMELVEGGELFDRIVAHGQFDEKTTKFLFRQMCLGVKYLHDRSITHRDLKPENVLLSQPECNETLVKITDFGLSKFINETSLMKTFCGTPNYLAPEVLTTRGEASYTNKVDVWSLGVILYICLVGYPPFSESASGKTLNDQIIQGLYTFPDEFWSEVSDSVKDLIRKMMCVDPVERFSIAEVLQHPWLADDLDNTTRVENIMYPTPPSTSSKQKKRPAEQDEDSLDKETATPLSSDDTPKAKRAKP